MTRIDIIAKVANFYIKNWLARLWLLPINRMIECICQILDMHAKKNINLLRRLLEKNHRENCDHFIRLCGNLSYRFTTKALINSFLYNKAASKIHTHSESQNDIGSWMVSICAAEMIRSETSVSFDFQALKWLYNW